MAQQQQQQQEKCNIDILSVFSDGALHNAEDFCAKRIGSLTENLHGIKRAIKKTKRIKKAIDIELVLRFDPPKDNEEEEEFYWPAAESEEPPSQANPAPVKTEESGTAAGFEIFLGEPGFKYDNPHSDRGASANYGNNSNQHNDNDSGNFTPIASDDSSIFKLRSH